MSGHWEQPFLYGIDCKSVAVWIEMNRKSVVVIVCFVSSEEERLAGQISQKMPSLKDLNGGANRSVNRSQKSSADHKNQSRLN